MPLVLTQSFNREDHLYHCPPEFEELVKDAVRFFNGTPVHPLPPPEKFMGAGVYAIYCISKSGIYADFGRRLNRTAYNVPIYVGKAVPDGWRQSRSLDDAEKSTDLYQRLGQHTRSIKVGSGLSISDFACRFAIFEGPAIDMIAAIEAALIAEHRPLWNSVVDGFGNHDPGAGRREGMVPQWDAIHPGRKWAEKLTGGTPDPAMVRRRIKDYLTGRQ